jgi:hypothetical protein
MTAMSSKDARLAAIRAAAAARLAKLEPSGSAYLVLEVAEAIERRPAAGRV